MPVPMALTQCDFCPMLWMSKWRNSTKPWQTVWTQIRAHNFVGPEQSSTDLWNFGWGGGGGGGGWGVGGGSRAHSQKTALTLFLWLFSSPCANFYNNPHNPYDFQGGGIPSQRLHNIMHNSYNSFLVYCRELAPGTVSLTGDRAKGDDSKNSKWVWSGNTTITNCRQPRGTARKSRSTISKPDSHYTAWI